MYSQTSCMESHMEQIWGIYPSWLQTYGNQRISTEMLYNLGNANAVVVFCVSMTCF